MWVIWMLIGIVVGGWALLMVQSVRATRLMNADWAIRTSLPDSRLNELIMKAMKGMNPIATVGRPAPGVYTREIARGAGERSRNHALFTTTVTRADDEPNEFLVHCEIQHWRGPGFFGAKVMGSVFKCRRRINAVMRAIQAADPSAATLAHPSQPQLPATTGV